MNENKIKILKDYNQRLFDDLYYLKQTIKKKEELIERNRKEI